MILPWPQERPKKQVGPHETFIDQINMYISHIKL